MIKLFKNIRRNLLTENKFSKYLLYALGEIILVVIGILIALSINNSNEDRKARRQEVKYLKNLQTDIGLEIINNDSLINYRGFTAKAAARILDFKTLESVDDIMALEQNVNQVFARQTFIPTNNTFKELLSSGNLSYITNDSIIDYLLELDKIYVSIGNGEHHMYREYEEYLYNVSIKNGPVLNMLDVQKVASTGLFSFADPSQIPAENVIPDYNRLLKMHEFRNGLKLSVMNNIGLKNTHSAMASHLEKLNDLIQNDLENN